MAYLFRDREISLRSHSWYDNALAHVDDPTLFLALMSGEHAVRGFANRDLCAELAATALRLSSDPKRQRAQVSRLLRRLHVYGLVAKIPRSRRSRVTALGHRAMGASVKLRKRHFPALCAEAA